MDWKYTLPTTYAYVREVCLAKFIVFILLFGQFCYRRAATDLPALLKVENCTSEEMKMDEFWISSVLLASSVAKKVISSVCNLALKAGTNFA